MQNLSASKIVDLDQIKQAKTELTQLQEEFKTIQQRMEIDPQKIFADQLNNHESKYKNMLYANALNPSTYTDEDIKAAKNKYQEWANEQKKINAQIASSVGLDWSQITNTISTNLSSALTTPLQEGETAFQRFGNLGLNIIQSLGQSAINYLIKQITLEKTILAIKTAAKAVGTLLGNFGSFSAKGNAFNGGNVIPFAKGGIVNKPTTFPMAGGKVGMFGEAGYEAALPLKRMTNGDLGVQAQAAPANVNIYNQSGADIETVQRPDGETDVFIRKVNNALNNERTQNGFSRALQRNQQKGVQAS